MLFGEILSERMHLSRLGRVIRTCWLAMHDHFDYVKLDELVIMPNHLHGIILIVEHDTGGIGRGDTFVSGSVGARHASPGGDTFVSGSVGARHASPGGDTFVARSRVTGRRGKGDTCVAPTGPRPRSLGAVIGSFKAAVTRRVGESSHGSKTIIWQRNYYEHIIRDDDELSRIREYVSTNFLQWELDRENPARNDVDEFDTWLAGFKNRPQRA